MSSWSRLALLVALAATLSTTVADTNSTPLAKSRMATLRGTPLEARAPPADKKVIAQMFQWNWDSIARECTEFLGPAGYGYVQVSPPQESIQGDEWWTDYQPVSYKLRSKHGNRNQLSKMIDTCHSAGVKVIVDTIWNHMQAGNSGVGTGGSRYRKYNYPGVWQDADFHTCRHPIKNYQDVQEVQNCELDGLADLATESTNVRNGLAAYSNDLIDLGVDGFRLDSAKHIPETDLQAIIGLLKTNGKALYFTQEVIAGTPTPASPTDYVSTGDVQEFRYIDALKSAFYGRSKLSDLQDLSNRGWVPSEQANVFVSNHDTERSRQLSTRSPHNAYVLATVFSLAYPYGSPTILSSYRFSDSDAGAPNGGFGTCDGDDGARGWLCQHRWTEIAGMVGFHNAVGNAALTEWVAPTDQRIAFGRGGTGFIAINNEDQVWAGTFKTDLADGQYCDVINGPARRGRCKTITVSSGSFRATVPARGAIAIYTGAMRT